MCLEMDVVLMKLKIGEVAEARTGLDEGLKVLDSISTSESFVFSKFYKSSYEYRKVNKKKNIFSMNSTLLFSVDRQLLIQSRFVIHDIDRWTS